MTKRQTFKIYYEDEVSLKDIAYFMDINYWTCKRWKQLYLKSKLITPYGLRRICGNKRSTINKQKILEEYLALAKDLMKNYDKVIPYTFSYFVKYKLNTKCSLSTFKNIMKRNSIASPWAWKETKRAYKKDFKI